MNAIATEAVVPDRSCTPLDELRCGCREELARYRAGAPHDDSFCLEIFRRAVVEQDEACWRALHEIFHDQVLSWCRSACGGACHDPEELVCVAWEKFWLHFTPAKFVAANGAAGVLRYVKLCARSAAVDASRSGPGGQPLDERSGDWSDGGPSLADEHADRDACAQFWTIVNASLRSDRERVLAHLSYEIGLRSCEIRAHRPDLFPSSADVYQVTRNIVDRLRRNRALRAWAGYEQG